jgi:hypothetical protein
LITSKVVESTSKEVMKISKEAHMPKPSEQEGRKKQLRHPLARDHGKKEPSVP